jgi:hypothetical protein
VALGQPAEIASTIWNHFGANDKAANAAKDPKVGIFAKGHIVAAALGRHASLRIVPKNQHFWRFEAPEEYRSRFNEHPPDENGNYFVTIGAGSSAGDTSLDCHNTNLTKGINRANDLTYPPIPLEHLSYTASDEDAVIGRLFKYYANYQNELTYCWNPSLVSSTFNSNSFIHGLLNKASIPEPLFIRVYSPRFVGWGTPLPTGEFDSHR